MDHTSADDATNEALLAKQAARESSARTYPRELPIAIDEAAGIEIVDMDGNRYYDCLAGAGTLALGHNHPAVIEAMGELLDRGWALHTLDITTPAKERFVEAVQGEGGSIPAPDAWLRRLREITRERDVPLIVDEIQAGLGRTGELYAFEHAGIVPDVVTLSKAVGGGLPLSVMLYDESVLDWKSGAHAGTFRGNQLAMAAGRATIEQIVDKDLPTHAAAMGERFLERFAAIDERFAAVGDVRGRGLMLGLELVDPAAEPDPAGSQPTDPALAARVRRAALDRGLIVELGGRANATVRLLPPLVVTPEAVDEIASILEEALAVAVD